MNLIENLRKNLEAHSNWVRQGAVLWLEDLPDIRRLAAVMNESGSRFVTITATELPDRLGIRLEYLWDFDGQLLGFPFHLTSAHIASICDLCPAADWIEREVREGFAVEFTGGNYEPLLLREGDKPGVNLREEVR